jgi:hypothetical protein
LRRADQRSVSETRIWEISLAAAAAPWLQRKLLEAREKRSQRRDDVRVGIGRGGPPRETRGSWCQRCVPRPAFARR